MHFNYLQKNYLWLLKIVFTSQNQSKAQKYPVGLGSNEVKITAAVAHQRLMNEKDPARPCFKVVRLHHLLSD